ncbi:PorP/SprF family type IX secretion system membrane protein [Chryseolinea soli]|uniref:Type IX secretion system membrane protein PorP/SprF n=1 Tax=Chryseolinea soli TaxID=2321403 RepID=A0A385SPC1_9BACT|nr:PorP/SprF family type IX secretion system membrane protein [Chryseolinea soli]AYB33593.1 type IX secretion system membrane protein PorP/SprF [Chryseolinea soli]
MKISFRILLFCTAWMITGPLQAQQNLVYSHYFLNPFLYNPSFVAPNGYSELYLNYRNQWTGIEGAPVTGTVSLHLALNHKTGIAFTGYQDKAGALKTTTGLATFAYQVYLGNSVSDDHKLAFGLSAGATSVSIHGDNSFVNEPVVGTTSSFEGQFGMHYQHKNLKIAFAIPRLFNTYVASDQDFNKVGFKQVRTTLSSVSYAIPIGERIVWEPMVTYRTYENTPSQFEGLGVLRMDNIVWFGGSYRQRYGASAFAGFNIKDKLKLGYAYEFAASQVNALGNGTHEIQLVVRLGKKKLGKSQTKAKTPLQRPQAVADTASVADLPNEDVAQQEKSESATLTGQSTASAATRQDEPVIKPPEPASAILPATVMPTHSDEEKQGSVKSLSGNGLPPGHYVVVGAFRSVENAKRYARNLKRSDYPADVAYHPGRQYYIVHMNHAATIEEARQLRDKYRQMSRYSFRDTWILSIE